jgi:hypothetical protein
MRSKKVKVGVTTPAMVNVRTRKLARPLPSKKRKKAVGMPTIQVPQAGMTMLRKSTLVKVVNQFQRSQLPNPSQRTTISHSPTIRPSSLRRRWMVSV